MDSDHISLPIPNTASPPAVDPVCGTKVNVSSAKHTFNDSGTRATISRMDSAAVLSLTAWRRFFDTRATMPLPVEGKGKTRTFLFEVA